MRQPLLLLTLITAIGCVEDTYTPRVPVDAGRTFTDAGARAFVHDTLPQARLCFRQELAFCVTEPAYIDAITRPYLDVHFDGRYPTNGKWLRELMTETRPLYEADMRGPGREKVEALVRARWNDPTIKFLDDFGGAHIGLGMPPGRLIEKGGHFQLKSSLVKRQELDSLVAARLLDTYQERYVHQKVIKLSVDLPVDGGRFRRLDYYYFRGADRVVVFEPGNLRTAWSTPPLKGNLGPYLRGKRSLHTSALNRCAILDYGKPPDCRDAVPTAKD